MKQGVFLLQVGFQIVGYPKGALPGHVQDVGLVGGDGAGQAAQLKQIALHLLGGRQVGLHLVGAVVAGDMYRRVVVVIGAFHQDFQVVGTAVLVGQADLLGVGIGLGKVEVLGAHPVEGGVLKGGAGQDGLGRNRVLIDQRHHQAGGDHSGSNNGRQPRKDGFHDVPSEKHTYWEGVSPKPKDIIAELVQESKNNVTFCIFFRGLHKSPSKDWTTRRLLRE